MLITLGKAIAVAISDDIQDAAGPLQVCAGHLSGCEAAVHVIFSDALLLAVLWRQGSMMPSPPKRTGNAIRSLSASLKAFWPVRDGKKSCLIAFSTGLSRSPMSGMVLSRYVHLLV